MAQLVSVSALNANSKIRRSNPAGDKKSFRLENSILNKIEIHLKIELTASFYVRRSSIWRKENKIHVITQTYKIVITVRVQIRPTTTSDPPYLILIKT